MDSTFRSLLIHTHWKEGKTLGDSTDISCSLVVSKRSPIYYIINRPEHFSIFFRLLLAWFFIYIIKSSTIDCVMIHLAISELWHHKKENKIETPVNFQVFRINSEKN